MESHLENKSGGSLNSESSNSSLPKKDFISDAETSNLKTEASTESTERDKVNTETSSTQNKSEFLNFKYPFTSLPDKDISDAGTSSLKTELFSNTTRENEINAETSLTEDISKTRTSEGSNTNLMEKDNNSNAVITANSKTETSSKTTLDDKNNSEISLAERISEFKNLNNHKIFPVENNMSRIVTFSFNPKPLTYGKSIEDSRIKLSPLFTQNVSDSSNIPKKGDISNVETTASTAGRLHFTGANGKQVNSSIKNISFKPEMGDISKTESVTENSSKITEVGEIHTETSTTKDVSIIPNTELSNLFSSKKDHISESGILSWQTERLFSKQTEENNINLETSSTKDVSKIPSFKVSIFNIPDKNDIITDAKTSSLKIEPLQTSKTSEEESTTSKTSSTKDISKTLNDYTEKSVSKTDFFMKKINFDPKPFFIEPEINFIGERIMFQDESIRLLQFKLSGDYPIFEAKDFKIFKIQSHGVKCNWKIYKNSHSFDLELYNCYDLNENDMCIKVEVKFKSPKYSPNSNFIFLNNVLNKDLPVRWALFNSLFEPDSTFEIAFEIYIRRKSTLISNEFATLFNNSDNSDLTFTVGDEKFYAHWAVLAKESMVFKKCFAACPKFEIKIENVEPEVVKLFLQYFYTGKISPSKSEQWLPLTLLAYQYRVYYLIDSICSKNLAINCSVENVLEAYALFDKMGKMVYKWHAEKFILANINKIGQDNIEAFFESNPNLGAELTAKLLLSKSEVEIKQKLKKNMIKDLFGALSSD